MIRSIRWLVIAAALCALAGCFRGPVPTPSVPLERAEQRAVTACQALIGRQVLTLSTSVFQQLRSCAAAGLDLRLEEERELDSSNIGEFVARREALKAQCETRYETAGRSSTRMLDAVLARCRNVEPQLLTDALRGDPLGFRDLDFGELEAPAVENVDELASHLCGVAVGSAELLLSFSFPRIGDLVARYYGITDEDDFRALWRPFLDPRCGTAVSGL